MVTSTPRPTLAQVAQAAQVSKATASKVLNGRPHVAPETRRRVEAAIAQLAYSPSTGPRDLGTSKSISIVFSTLADIYAMRVLEGVVAAAHAQRVEVVVDVLDAAPADHAPLSPEWIRALAARRRTGVVVVTTDVTAEQRELLRSLDLPTVHIDPVNPDDAATVSVAATNFRGGAQATQHLVDLGHRRIALAGGSPGSLPARERLSGYHATLATAGVERDPALVHLRGFRFSDGLATAEHLLALDHPPTAVVASSDSSALGVLEAARRRGLRVPEDLSVVGFDDTYAATTSAPALTTVHQPIVEMGRVALRTLLQLADGEPIDTHHVQLSTQLVVRKSTAPPRAV